MLRLQLGTQGPLVLSFSRAPSVILLVINVRMWVTFSPTAGSRIFAVIVSSQCTLSRLQVCRTPQQGWFFLWSRRAPGYARSGYVVIAVLAIGSSSSSLTSDEVRRLVDEEL
ncbi:unnamed protein product [Linum trigynum]|uniref:Uncharacterized protein n=1 Tax=Linum trigynum TaxID=586398 RepID=A0AAV2F8P8_9ROSI